jgi:hypothetical protein
MTNIDVYSPEATAAAANAMRWINHKANKKTPFILKSIEQAIKKPRRQP